MENGILIEIVTKYNEKYDFENAQQFNEFVKEQQNKWNAIDIDFDARVKRSSLGMSAAWERLFEYITPLSTTDRTAGSDSLPSNQNLRNFQSSIQKYFSNGFILIFDSIEGKAFRDNLHKNYDFVIKLREVIGLFNKDMQDSQTEVQSENGRKVFHVILDCRIQYEMFKAKKEINVSYELAYQDLKSFLDSGKFTANEIKEEIKTKSDALQQLESDNKALLENTKKEFESLKSALKEKLALSEPVTYWERCRERYKVRSILWGVLSVVFAGVFISLIWLGLENIPDISNISDVKNQIKVTVLFIAGIGVMTYVVSMFGRLFLSSMHMLSDIEERSNLTHFYLSLIEGGKLDEKQREIILQSLFSRTDSGIIKGGTEMNFPGSIESLKSLLKSK